MTAKKILIPIIGFGSTGGYRVLSELANHWIGLGHQVDFLVHRSFALPYFPTRAGIRIFDISGKTALGDDNVVESKMRPRAGSIYLGMFRALNHIGSGYDVVFANHSMTTFPVAFARCGRAKKYYYVQAYEPEFYHSRRGWKGRVLEALSVASYSLPLQQVANAPIYLGYKRVAATDWVPPGIDLSGFYRRFVAPMHRDGRAWTVGTIGRHELAKGTKYVLEAFDKLALVDPDVRLKVAYGNLPSGWSHERAEIVVPKNDKDLADYYRSVDVLVAPGIVQHGACHYPVMEAMACGTPVVTTGYLPADSSNAWIVPVHDSAAIVNVLLEIRSLAPLDLEAKLKSAAAAIAPFDWTNVAKEFLRLFDTTGR
ncbi:glycosyltransferase family 4 protein [Rhodanobacter glycinis]|uniref:Glycosyltransferase family 4 protein n=1 Tax=Rhodanobacter glycinis TaxID=582702 RepID=A0A5B9E3U3_9GAMM|nr:glycosyltransferase family 4 protein [Rhodanobacter glycinis]QEE25645.1 glycosyltransferase family 4 protein [Rhodanobacter glycinis]